MKEITIKMNPFPAPRMSRRDSWNPSSSAQRFFRNRDQFKLLANTEGLTELPPAMGFTFHIPMPASWSKSKKAKHFGQMHQQKPDLDNMIKAVLDCLTYGREKDDAHMGTILMAQKIWAAEGEGRIMLYIPEAVQDSSRMKVMIDTMLSKITELI